MKKIRIDNKQASEISNYNISEYFNEYIANGYGRYGKMVGAIYNDKYVIEYGPGDKYDHLMMIYEIMGAYGSFKTYVASSGRELNIFSGKEITESQIDTIIEILCELKEYYERTNNNVEIRPIGTAIEGIISLTDCTMIDDVINNLCEAKNVKSR